MNGTPPSLEEKVRHCGEEQEYRGSLLTAIRVTENHSMIGGDDVSKEEGGRQNRDDVG